jgi:WD40 repeat protein
VWRLADGTPVGPPLTGHTRVVWAVAVGALPDGTPVIVSGSRAGPVRVWRLARRRSGRARLWRRADGTPVGQPLTGHTGTVWAVAIGALPDGTPVIVSGGDDGTVRVWRLADGTPAGPPLTGHTGPVRAVAIGALPDGTPVIVSGGEDRTVRVWRLADGKPLGYPLRLPAPVMHIAVDGNTIVTAGGDLAAHELALQRPMP